MRQPNAPKLFVGQIPLDWTDAQLRPHLEPYGEIYSLVIIKDQVTGKPKGCAFVTYYESESAKSAQAGLHESKILPGLNHAIQVKPAKSETREENRTLFIGNVRNADASELSKIFSAHGVIEDITILKNSSGKSKGCAFLKFETRLQAQNAIRNLHNSLTMEGNTSAIIVKLADTEKEKANKRLQMNIVSGNSTSPISRNVHATSLINNALNHPQQQQQQLLTQVPLPNNQLACIVSNQNVFGAPSATSGTLGALLASASHQSQMPTQQGLQSLLNYPGGVMRQPAAQSNLSGGLPSTALQNQTATALRNQATNYLHNQLNGTALIGGGVANYSTLGGLSTIGSIVTPGNSTIGATVGNTYGSGAGNALGASAGNAFGASTASVAPTGLAASSTLPTNLQQAYSIQQYVANFPQTYNNIRQNASIQLLQQSQQQKRPSTRRDGPDDANLFIYHLPTEYKDHDLLQAFLPFGNVINAKVYVDKVTNHSKGFGFVSYDKASSAALAIRSMNGHAVGSKRLKVQLKTKKERTKPY